MKRIISVLCFFGIHLSGRSDCGCMYDVKVCDHCKRDVLLFVKDRA